MNTATVRKQGDLADIIDACARHGIRATILWRDQVATISLDRAVRAVRDAGLELSGYCRGGMFTSDAAHQIRRDDNRRTVVRPRRWARPASCWWSGLTGNIRGRAVWPRNIAAARAQVDDAIAEMTVYARDANMPLAISRCIRPSLPPTMFCVNTTKQALDICDRLDPQRTKRARRRARRLSHLVGPGIAAADRRARKDRLLAFHVCDWLVPTTDILMTAA